MIQIPFSSSKTPKMQLQISSIAAFNKRGYSLLLWSRFSNTWL